MCICRVAEAYYPYLLTKEMSHMPNSPSPINLGMYSGINCKIMRPLLSKSFENRNNVFEKAWRKMVSI